MGKVVPTVLVVDDEHAMRWTLRNIIERASMKVEEACDGGEALQMIQTHRPDVMLLDLQMPGMHGCEVLRQAKALSRSLPIIIITAYACIEDAVHLVKAGAFNYLSKPFDNDHVIELICRALNGPSNGERYPKPPVNLEATLPLEERMGTSPAIQTLSAEVRRVAATDLSVLITGETGTGKEIVAQAIHAQGDRAMKPFVPVDCGAIPETLVESELFGHEKGAFTGANQAKCGKFETAAGGTLFFDEISNMPVSLQSTLLRALEEKSFYHVGGNKPVKADVRVLAATNQDLLSPDSGVKFRQDLYYRLAEYVVHIPPLRERRQDIGFLVRRFMARANDTLGKNVRDISELALAALMVYNWPGNVRELRNVIREAVLLADDVIEPQHLRTITMVECTVSMTSLGLGSQSLREIVRRTVVDLEKHIFSQALEQAHGNKAEVARLLKVDYKTVHTKVKEYGIRTRR